jgi:hypothetical protein
MHRSASTLVRSPYPPEVRATRLLPGIVLLVGALLAGCSSPTPGTPTPAAPVASTPAGPPELALDGVDPCSLITEADRETFNLSPSRMAVSPRGFPICRWNRGAVAFQIGIALDTSLDSYRQYGDHIKVTQINGYTALQMQQPGAKPGRSCIITIAVKPQQIMQVVVDDIFSTVFTDDIAICKETARFAHAAVIALHNG